MRPAIVRFTTALSAGLVALTTAAPSRAEIAFSPDGSRVAFSASGDRGLHMVDIGRGSISTLTDTPSSGYTFAWSPDGTKLGFKVLHATADGYLQEPAVYDVVAGAVRSLAAPTFRAGIPSFSARGDIAFTQGHEAVITTADGVVSRHDLGHDVNIVALSPDGTQLAYNGPDDSIWVLHLPTGTRRLVTRQPSYGPSWSADGKRLLLRGINGTISCADFESGQVRSLGRGISPAWLPDGQTVIFTATGIPRGDGRPPPASVETVRFDGTARRVLPGVTGYDARLSADGTTLVYRATLDGAPLLARVGSPSFSVTQTAALLDTVKSRRASPALPTPLPPSPSWRSSPVVIPGVPYLHQVYDTPNHFNGDWACNATSAVMTLAYYGVLDQWDTTVDVPSPHVSAYGNYVSEIYTVNGHTLDVGSPDPDGDIAYGGYGYIVQGDWEDTKGHMAEYIGFHGPESSVDWSPSWDKVIAEVQAQHPFVVLTSITSVGHYIVNIGYHTDQHTAVFNDPYGNKNAGYMNYDGAGAQYDWPGYNNGFSNLNTVHCFIWSRATLPPPQDAGLPPEPDASPVEDAPPTEPEAEPEADAASSDSTPDVLDGSEPSDSGSPLDASPRPSGAPHAADPDACACALIGDPARSAAPWSLVAVAFAWLLRRRRS